MDKEQEPIKFLFKGFPSINIYQNYFEIKDIDHWTYKTSYKFNSEFRYLIKILNEKLKRDEI